MGHPELEAKLIDHPDDDGAYLVYADYLQSTGDPRGTLMALGTAGKHAAAASYINEHADALLGPLAKFQKTLDGQDDDAFTWHRGFIRSARLSYDSNSAGDEKLEDILELLLHHPSAVLLQELVVPINMLDDGMYFGPIVEKLAAIGAPALRTLRIGEFKHAGPGSVEDSDYDYEMSWTSLGDASGLWKALPRLEFVRLQVGLGGSAASGGAESVGEVIAPKLKHLEVITGGMSSAIAQAFAAARAPELESMDLWFGTDNYGGTTTAADLAPLFDGAGVPKLAHLGLMNSEIANDFAAALGSSKILKRLRELDLAYGTLTDDGVAALDPIGGAYGHLAKLDVRANCLSADGVAAVRRLCANAVVDEQKDEDEHYVSLSE